MPNHGCFELFAFLVLAYLCFTSIAFLVDARSLIFPRFILDQSIGNHADRARGPFLQAVANGVSLNLLGLVVLHSYARKRTRSIGAPFLLMAVPVAVLATMTRAVWLSFATSVAILVSRSRRHRLKRIAACTAIVACVCLLATLSFESQRRALADRFGESGPIGFRQAVYAGGWQMFLEKPLLGWGVNRMPTELARHVSGYKEMELFPHNTYLEILVEHGMLGLALYAWLMWEILRLHRAPVPISEGDGFLNAQFHRLWPVLMAVYCMNAAVVVMNYQFVNGLLFGMAGMLAAQKRRAARTAVESC